VFSWEGTDKKVFHIGKRVDYRARVLQGLMKPGNIKKPRCGSLGSMLVSFLYDAKVCRKLVPLVVDSTAKNAVRLHLQTLYGGQFNMNPWQGTKNKRRRKRQNNFQQGKLSKVELQILEASTMPLIAKGLRENFLGSGCLLLGLKAQLGDAVKVWANAELLQSEEYLEFMKTKKALEDMKNNGASDSKVRFYEKLRLLYAIGLSSKLNLAPSAVDSTLESIANELKNFQ
jgi:hypothetical protein